MDRAWVARSRWRRRPVLGTPTARPGSRRSPTRRRRPPVRRVRRPRIARAGAIARATRRRRPRPRRGRPLGRTTATRRPRPRRSTPSIPVWRHASMAPARGPLRGPARGREIDRAGRAAPTGSPALRTRPPDRAAPPPGRSRVLLGSEHPVADIFAPVFEGAHDRGHRARGLETTIRPGPRPEAEDRRRPPALLDACPRPRRSPTRHVGHPADARGARRRRSPLPPGCGCAPPAGRRRTSSPSSRGATADAGRSSRVRSRASLRGPCSSPGACRAPRRRGPRRR